MLSNNSIVVQNWYSSTLYHMFDMTAGINISGVSYYGPLYTSTVSNNQGNNPSGQFVYAINSYSRSNDIATINITYTGTQPKFSLGSIIQVTGTPDTVLNWTGMMLNAQVNGGNSMSLYYVNPGPEESQQNTTLGGVNCAEPSWTTGFFFLPGYASPWDVAQGVITAKFENNYSQRQPNGLTSNVNTWNLSFDTRSNREARAIMAFVQNLQGVYSTTLVIPPTTLYNNPNLKYVLTSPKTNTHSFNNNDVTVSATQVSET